MNWYRISQSSQGAEGNRSLTVQDCGGHMNIVPIIQIRGKWLKDAGFYPKDVLNVSVSRDTITLTISQKSEDKRMEDQEINRLRQEKEQEMALNPQNKINIPKV